MRSSRPCAENLGRAKRCVLASTAPSRWRSSRSHGPVAAARAFLAQKPAGDRLGRRDIRDVPAAADGLLRPTAPTRTPRFSRSRSTRPGHNALRRRRASPRLLGAEPLDGRVIIVVTDGNETPASVARRRRSPPPQDAHAAIYVVAIESPDVQADPLRRLAPRHGGATTAPRPAPRSAGATRRSPPSSRTRVAPRVRDRGSPRRAGGAPGAWQGRARSRR